MASPPPASVPPGRRSAGRRLLWGLGYLWGAPITVAGAVQALVGARLARVDGDGVLHFVARRRGPVAWFMRRFRVSAYTLGAVITYADAGGPELGWLVRHERHHVGQTFVLGPLMALAYPLASAWSWARGRPAYQGNWFEVEARKAEGLRRVR